MTIPFDPDLFDPSVFETLRFDLTPMSGVASTMAVLLAMIFAVAAALKIVAPSATASEFSELGVPAPRLSARAVPIGELATAAALIIAPRLGAGLAALWLVAFIAVLVATIRSGRTVSCGCLGALSRQPVSITTAARNLALLAMAAVASSTNALSWPDPASVMVSISLLLMAALLLQLVALRQAIGRIWSVELAGEGGGSGLGTTDMKGMTA